MKPISFKAPQGFAAPEDAEPGKPFDVLASVTLSDDGTLSLTAVDGIELSEAEAEEETETPDEDAGFMESVEARMA